MDGFPPEEIAYQQANFYDNRSTTLIVVTSIFAGAAVISFILRIAARRVAKVHLSWDDYLSLGATLSLIGVTITACLCAHYGIGRHLLHVAQDPDNFIKIGKITLGFSVTYDCSMALGKLSVLALYARIFTLSSRSIQISVYFLAFFTIAWWTSGILVIFLQCRPLSTTWGSPHQCRPAFHTSVIVGTFNVVSDIAILALPQPAIWGLQLSIGKKIGLSIVFLIGLLATVVGIARMPLLKGANTGSEIDSTYTSVNGFIFTAIEPACVVLCGCLPMMPGLFNRLIKSKSKSAYGNMSGARSDQSEGKHSWTGAKRVQASGNRKNLAGNSSSLSESTERFELSHTASLGHYTTAV